VACGQEVTANITLDGDLHCSSGPALIVTADNVTVDLAGHTISGDGDETASTPGILLRNVKGVTVQKGTVERFGAGVAIQGGANNVIQNMTLQDNVGDPAGDFGDGIAVNGSSGNRIRGNTVRRNGPFSGISLVGACTNNEIRENVVTDNNMLPGQPQRGRQDMGIRIEGPAANNNRVVGNTVTGSGADGIVVLPTCADPQRGCTGTPGNEGNEISKNASHRNGTSGNGSGIRLFSVPAPVAATKTTVADNVTNENTTHGVAVDAAGAGTPQPFGNRLTGNQGRGNLQFDGFDGNATCGSNTWSGNDFVKVNQPCVSAAGAPAAAASAFAAADPMGDEPVETRGSYS
jgi:parallel beta-helix repeat protein